MPPQITIEVGMIPPTDTAPGMVEIGLAEARGSLNGQPLYLQINPIRLTLADLNDVIAGLIESSRLLAALQATGNGKVVPAP